MTKQTTVKLNNKKIKKIYFQCWCWWSIKNSENWKLMIVVIDDEQIFILDKKYYWKYRADTYIYIDDVFYECK